MTRRARAGFALIARIKILLIIDKSIKIGFLAFFSEYLVLEFGIMYST